MDAAKNRLAVAESSPWWVTLAEGVVLALMGLFVLVSPGGAGGILLQVIALVLLVQSVLQVIGSLRGSASRDEQWSLLQAGVGATIGALVVIDGWFRDYLTIDAARGILGIGLLAFAVLGLLRAFLGGDRPEGWVPPVVNAALLAVLALLLLTTQGEAGLDRLRLIGAIALIGGVVVAFLAWRRREASA